MATRIDDVRPAAEDRDRRPAGGQRPAMGGAVDPPRHPADDHETGGGHEAAEPLGDLEAV